MTCPNGHRFTYDKAIDGKCQICLRRNFFWPLLRMNDYFQRRNVMRLLGSIPDILRSAPRHRRRRGIRKFLPVVLLLAAGAAFSVLIVYSFLPDDAQTWVLRIQAKIKELAP